jgi:hypothetical protein
MWSRRNRSLLMRLRENRKAILGLLIGSGFIFATWILNHRIRTDSEARERHFVAVYFIAMEATKELGDTAPKTIEELLAGAECGANSVLLKPFCYGLKYRFVDGGFELNEPTKGFVTLLQRDRLIASYHTWPHWESSGCNACKFSGQQIPSNFLRTNGKKS